MNELYWMPVLDMRYSTEQEDGPDLIERFLRAHGRRGHIIAPAPSVHPSWATPDPTTDHVWCTSSIPEERSNTSIAAIELTIDLPVGLNSPAMATLSAALSLAPLKRIVIKRPFQVDLPRIETSLATLKDALWDTTCWIDYASFGEDAVSYLTYRYRDVQVAGLTDSELSWFLRLGTATGRPVVLFDYSGNPNVPIQPLPRFINL